MKAYKDIMEWLATNPKEEEIEYVVSFIKQRANITAAIERIRYKREILWYDKIKRDFEIHGIKTFRSSAIFIRKELLN